MAKIKKSLACQRLLYPHSIFVENTQKSLKISSSSVKSLVEALLSKLQAKGEVTVHLVSKKKITQLHKVYFNDPTPTDCITLPIRTPEILGDVFVCPEAAIECNPEDPYIETTLYIVHSILHLLGYDDIASKDRALMRKKEKECLAFLKHQSLSIGH